MANDPRDGGGPKKRYVPPPPGGIRSRARDIPDTQPGPDQSRVIPDTDPAVGTDPATAGRRRRGSERTSWAEAEDDDVVRSVEFDAWADPEPPKRPSAVDDAEPGGRSPSRTPSGLIPLDGEPGSALGEIDRGRVTIDFSGPPLDLPEPPSGEFQAPPPIEFAADPGASAPGAVGAGPDHDAWVADRRRRSTVPPSAGHASAAPAPPLQHRWMSPAQAAQGRQIGDSVVGELPAADGDALELVDRSRPSEPQLDILADVRARYALDDLSGALKAAELVLGAEPGNVEAKRYAESCRTRLEQLYSSQIGPPSGIPRVVVAETDIRWLGLDHRAGFLLSRVDGMTSVDELLDVSGMPRLEALKTVVGLIDAGAIVIDPA